MIRLFATDRRRARLAAAVPGQRIRESLHVAEGDLAQRLADRGAEGAGVGFVGAARMRAAAVQPETDQGFVAVGLGRRRGGDRASGEAMRVR